MAQPANHRPEWGYKRRVTVPGYDPIRMIKAISNCAAVKKIAKIRGIAEKRVQAPLPIA
jgi:hypothetical protein